MAVLLKFMRSLPDERLPPAPEMMINLTSSCWLAQWMRLVKVQYMSEEKALYRLGLLKVMQKRLPLSQERMLVCASGRPQYMSCSWSLIGRYAVIQDIITKIYHSNIIRKKAFQQIPNNHLQYPQPRLLYQNVTKSLFYYPYQFYFAVIYLADDHPTPKEILLQLLQCRVIKERDGHPDPRQATSDRRQVFYNPQRADSIHSQHLCRPAWSSSDQLQVQVHLQTTQQLMIHCQHINYSPIIRTKFSLSPYHYKIHSIFL